MHSLIKKNRIWELDFLRGLSVLLMVFDHVMVDIKDIFGKGWAQAGFSQAYEFADKYLDSALRVDYGRPIVLSLFFLICGISCSFSRSNLKRGIQVAICAAGVTCVSVFIDMPIIFGVLHMLAVAILTYHLISVLCRRDKIKTAVTAFALGVTVLFLNKFLQVNEGAYDINLFTAILGGVPTPSDFVSLDYFPIFPNVGYVLLGSAVAPILYPHKRSLLPSLDKYGWYKGFSFFGRFALWVYVLHQFVVIVILALVNFILIGSFIP